MDLEIWIIYLLASAALCFTPGPNTLLALTHGASHGVQKSAFTSLGGAAGFALVIAVCMVGLGALLSTSALAFTIVKWIGAGLSHLSRHRYLAFSAPDSEGTSEVRRRQAA